MSMWALLHRERTASAPWQLLVVKHWCAIPRCTPPKTAHKTLERLTCKHKTCLAGFFSMAAISSPKASEQFGSFLAASWWLQLSSEEGPQIYPKIAPRAPWQERPQ